MIHLTHTGQFAGIPFCGKGVKQAQMDGDRFQHPSYSNKGIALQLRSAELCPKCRTAWDKAGETEQA